MLERRLYISNRIIFMLGSCLMSSVVLAQQALPLNTEQAQYADALAQSAGEYDSVDQTYIHSLGMQQKAWNNPLAHMGEGQIKPGYSKYNWTPDTVLPVRIREGMMTLINLPSWELIEKVHIGSPESFGGEVVAPNSLMLYADPSYLGVDSNMIIFGRSGNRYVVYLRSETYNTDKITQSVVDVLVGPRWTPVANGGQLKENDGVTTMASDPTVPLFNARGSVRSNGDKSVNAKSGNDWDNGIEVNPEQIKFDLDIYLPNPDDVDIAPDNVWRDNVFTYIDLGPKALTMTQRPIVNLLLQDTEVPVGFRTRGPNSRLIVVEAIGDLVLRNGRKLICIKLRRDPAAGLEYTDYSAFSEQPYAYQNKLPVADPNVGPISVYGGSPKMNLNPYVPSSGLQVSETNIGAYANATGGFDPYAKQGNGDAAGAVNPYCSDTTGSGRCGNAIQSWQPMRSIPEDVKVNVSASMAAQAGDKVVIPMGSEESIALEFGTSPKIGELEQLWADIYAQNSDVLSGYEPYYSVDTTANGNMVELFRLRAGMIPDAQTGDAICRKVGRRGFSCSVVRVK
ncbi:MAG: TrbG/VirB9 family P-type conjugative transfer protein [Alphaproteobacteria bacterium]|nr:TrbG/VirB9 family P-type conjugative transfer protein [Alphaproteobacteria bacterium]